MEEIITVRDLYKSFGSKEVLKGLNLSVKRGERVAILGANGAGKTTLVNTIAQFSAPTQGEVTLHVEGNPKKEIGMQFQEGE